jgi:hypothetical protein
MIHHIHPIVVFPEISPCWKMKAMCQRNNHFDYIYIVMYLLGDLESALYGALSLRFS